MSATAAELAGDCAELARGRLAATRARIGAACAAAGRDPAEITLIAVTKTYPAADVLALAGLGLTDFGENRDQEAAPKAAAVAAGRAARSPGTSSASCRPTRRAAWPGTPTLVHSVDRVRLVRALGAAARAAGRGRTCLVQVSLTRVCLIQVSAGRRRRPAAACRPPSWPRSRQRSRPSQGSPWAG